MIDFDDVYAEHHAALLRYAESRCQSLQDAQDVCADAWGRAWKCRDKYDPAKSPVIAWLFMICRSAISDHYRGRAAAMPLSASNEPAAPAEQEKPDLNAAIDALPAELRAAVRVIYVEDRTFPEAAKALGVAVGTVHKRTVLGLRRLRRAMGLPDGPVHRPQGPGSRRAS